MKFLIGIIVTVLALTGATLTVLAIWGIQPISWEIIWKSGITMFIVCGTFLLVYLFYYLFFKGYSYNDKKGNKSHPLN